MQITPDQYRRIHAYLDKQKDSGRDLNDIVDGMLDEVLDIDVVSTPRRSGLPTWAYVVITLAVLTLVIVGVVLIGQAISNLGVRSY